MSALLKIAVSATRSWTTFYTAGLNENQRGIRLAEIESDLWEHQSWARAEDEPAVDTGFEILSRLLLGIPADLAWRHDATVSGLAPTSKTGARSMMNRLFAAIATVLTIVVGVVIAGITGLRGDGGEFALLPVAVGLVLIVGVVAGTWSRRIGTTLVAAGSIGLVSLMPWMAGATVPLGVVMVLGSMARGAGSMERKEPTQTA
jgi:hypothetical protein